MAEMPRILILMGSTSDEELMAPCWQQLAELGVEYRVRVASAHRTPVLVREVVAEAEAGGAQVIIAGAGWAAHLAGVVAGLTALPVIAVPLATSPLQGLDSLLASVQMPSGVPVATVAINGARNSALLAAQILALQDGTLAGRLVQLRERMADQVRSARPKTLPQEPV